MSHYLDKIKKHPLLEKSFSYILENNKSSNLPYHNIRHLIKVFNTSLNISNKMCISKKETIELGVACLFHDFNHSGGKLMDHENIKNTIDGLYDFYEIEKESFNGFSLENIISLIQHTEYPKIMEPNTKTQKIIMDSDLLQCYDIDWILYSVKGISDERNINIKDQIKDQIKFLNNVSYYTKYAKRLHKHNKNNFIKDTEYIKNLVKL